MTNNKPSITVTVQSLVNHDLYIQDALLQKYGNYSGIARFLLPKVRNILGQDVKLESVITAVKRANVSYQSMRDKIAEVIAKSIVHTRTDVAKISMMKTSKNLAKIRKTLINFADEFFHIIEGTSAITIVFDQKLSDQLVSLFREEEVLDQKQSLAALIIQGPVELISTPGCVLAFYSVVSRQNINIEETMSCFRDTIMVVSMENASKAFAALTDLIAEARNNRNNSFYL